MPDKTHNTHSTEVSPPTSETARSYRLPKLWKGKPSGGVAAERQSKKTFFAFMLLLATSALAPLTSFAKEPAGKTHPFFAIIDDSGNPKAFDSKSKLLHELGFDGVIHSQLKWLPERVASAKKYSLKVAQIYFHVNLSAKTPFDPNLAKILPCVKGQGTQLAVSFYGAKPADFSHEKRAVEILKQILTVADQSDVQVVLYPHYGSWLETVADNVRFAKNFPDRKVGVMFNLCHWTTVEQTDLESVLTHAKPWLAAVTINGSDTPEEMRAKKIRYGIKPLDSGTFDVSSVLKILKKIDYNGPVGLHCWFLKGDDHLKRSMKKWRELNGLSFAKEPAGKTYPFFAMINDSENPKSFDNKCKLLHELGFDGMAHFGLKWLPVRAAVAKKHSLRVAQIYFHVNLSAKTPLDPNLAKILPCVKGHGTQLAVTFDGVKRADFSHEKRAVEILKQIIAIADQSDVQVVLYPHYGSWLETVADNVRLAKNFPDRKVGVMFNLCHWTSIERANLEAVLTHAKPWLAAVTINGSDTPEEMKAKKIVYGIKPLDSGTFDVSTVLKILKKMDYNGPVGLHCWFLKGDDHLRRSMKKWRELNGL